MKVVEECEGKELEFDKKELDTIVTKNNVKEA